MTHQVKSIFKKMGLITLNDIFEFIKKNYSWFLGFISLILFLFGIFSDSKKDLFTAATVIIAAIAIFKNTERNKILDQRKRSKFYLKKYISGSKMVMDLLEADEPPRRMTWVSTAFIAKKLNDIEKNITEKSDQDFLSIHQRNYMHAFIKFIKQKSSIYFYGVDHASDLEDAANKCRINNGKIMEGLLPQMETLDIEEHDIATVFGLITQASLDDCGYSIIDKNGSFCMNVLKINHKTFPGLYAYLEHKKNCARVWDATKGCYILKSEIRSVPQPCEAE